MEDEQNNTIVARKMFMVKRLIDAELEAKRLCEFFTESTEVEVREKEDPPIVA